MELFGEIIGPSIQKGFSYGLKNNELGYVAFDLMVNGKYADYDDFKAFCYNHEIPTVPELYRGPFSPEVIMHLTNDHSHPFDKGNPCREGIVISSIKEKLHPQVGRLKFRNISERYYLKNDVTDFH